MTLINECFSAATVEDIFAQLESSTDPFAKETLTTMKKMSPLSLKITKRAMDEGSEMTLAECLQMEFRLSQRFVADHDFAEGSISTYYCSRHLNSLYIAYVDVEFKF